MLDMKKHSQGGSFTGALSFLPPGVTAEGQNYRISRMVLLRTSLLKKDGGDVSLPFKKDPVTEKTAPPLQNPFLKPAKKPSRKGGFFSGKIFSRPDPKETKK